MTLDGTLIPTDRRAEQIIGVKGEPIDAWYSGKAHRHAGNLQALSAPNGLPQWNAEVEPGSVHDLTAARIHVLGALYAAAARGLPTLADRLRRRRNRHPHTHQGSSNLIGVEA
ncbi:transposase family protein [Nonomuraea longicatena]|uniref:DDE Tnp4 domain-containing protein n=1 Tax=Nonomuraea longicatena TaxID=83682 RepID=A0ABP4B5G9_9ACTN